MTGITKARPLPWQRAGKWYRPTMLGLTLVILAFGLVVFVMRWRVFDAGGFLGIDYRTHFVFAERFLDTGSMYLPHQLSAPYDPQPLPHVPAIMPSMYPPHAIYLFAPFLFLPAILWWAIPIGLTAYIVATFRPAPWSWPVIAGLVTLPDTAAALIVGNTTMWLVAFVAAGLRWHWPAVLVMLKPSLAPFALIGIRRRSWWVAALALAVVSLPMLPSWFDYLVAVRNGGASPLYSLGSVPAMLIPVVAWLTRGTKKSPAPAERARAGLVTGYQVSVTTIESWVIPPPDEFRNPTKGPP